MLLLVSNLLFVSFFLGICYVTVSEKISSRFQLRFVPGSKLIIIAFLETSLCSVSFGYYWLGIGISFWVQNRSLMNQSRSSPIREVTAQEQRTAAIEALNGGVRGGEGVGGSSLCSLRGKRLAKQSHPFPREDLWGCGWVHATTVCVSCKSQQCMCSGPSPNMQSPCKSPPVQPA